MIYSIERWVETIDFCASDLNFRILCVVSWQTEGDGTRTITEEEEEEEYMHMIDFCQNQACSII